ncbi:MAG: hypothetical protein Q8Q25_00395 [bacterium]|nr:hypothetical protein [bacterium]
MNNIKTIRIILLLTKPLSLFGMEEAPLFSCYKKESPNYQLARRIGDDVSKKALQNFSCMDFSGCDPDVGDNMCQARAMQVLDMCQGGNQDCLHQFPWPQLFLNKI